MPERDYYEILGIPRGATTSEIRARYQTLQEEHDANPSGDITAINKAYKILESPSTRFKYNNRPKPKKPPVTEDKKTSPKPVPTPVAAPVTYAEPPSTPKLSEPKKELRHKKHRSIKRLVYSAIVGLIMVAGIIFGVKAYIRHHDAGTYQANLSTGSHLDTELTRDYKRYSTFSGSKPYSKTEWNNYYATVNSQVAAISMAASKTTSSSTSLTAFKNDILTTTRDFLSLVNLDKSSEDMRFQIKSDQDTVTSDQNMYEEDVTQDDTDCNLGSSNPYLTCSHTLEDGEKVDLNTATSQLTTDEQTLRSQESQALGLVANLSADFTQATAMARQLNQ